MTDLTIYGALEGSRAWWTAWMCRELGLDFENVPYAYLDPAIKSEDYLAINPNGLIPAIKDGDFALWDSMAINLYLAKKYENGGLSPASLEAEAQASQWSFWAMTRLEFPLLVLLADQRAFPEGSEMEQYFLKHVAKVTPEEVARCKSVLTAPLDVLNGQLADKPYLLGDEFSVADLNVACVFSRNEGAQVDLSSRAELTEWLTRCWSRPACPRSTFLLESLAKK